MPRDLFEHLLERMQCFQQQNPATAQHRQQRAHREHEAVKLRQRHHDAFVLPHIERRHATRHVVEKIAVREHRTLRMAGRAGGVKQGREVGLRPIYDLRFTIYVFGSAAAGLRRAQTFKLFHLEKFQLRTCGGQFGKMRTQLCAGDEHVRAGIIQDVTHLGGFQEVVDGHDHAAGRQNAEYRRHKLRTILHPQRHTVAGFYAELGLQAGGNCSVPVRESAA